MIRLEMTEMKEMMSFVPMENILWATKNKESGECSVCVKEWGEVLVTESTYNRYLKLKVWEALKDKNIPIYHGGGNHQLKGHVKMKNILAVEVNKAETFCIIYIEPGIFNTNTQITRLKYLKCIEKYLEYKNSVDTYLESCLPNLDNSEFEISDFDAPIEI